MREGDTSPTKRAVTIACNGDVDSAIRAYIQQFALGERKDLNRPYFAFPYGLAANESDFAFLADPSQVDLAYEFASIANSVPEFNPAGRWSFTDNQIDGHYASWLDFSVSAPIAIDPKERHRLREARAYCADHFGTYWTHFSDYYNALDELEACESIPIDHRTPDHERMLRGNERRVQHALLAWEVNGRRSEYERHHTLSEDLARRDPAFAKRELRQAMGAPTISGRGSFFWTSLIPSDAFANHSPWSPHEITFQPPDISQPADAPATLSLLSTRGRPVEHTVLGDLPVAGTRIAFEMTRLVIDRSWFMSLLLSSRNWKWANSTQDDPTGGDPLSDGQPQPTGKLVMIPREILFIRNKRIENPALSRRLAAQPTIDRTASLSFGPFGLQPPACGECHKPPEDGTGTESPPMVTFDLRAPSTVVATHMEYLAFVCELLPRTPDPNWKLWHRG